MLILDDFTGDHLVSALGTPWRGFSDQVMGGISQETIALTEIDGRRCLRLTGDVRLENSGGFLQMALDLAPEGQTLDASAYDGVLLVARGNGESYGVHLRTPDCVRPWQSYWAGFIAGPEWREIALPFDRFEPHRLMEPLDVRHLRRIGLVANDPSTRQDSGPDRPVMIELRPAWASLCCGRDGRPGAAGYGLTSPSRIAKRASATRS